MKDFSDAYVRAIKDGVGDIERLSDPWFCGDGILGASTSDLDDSPIRAWASVLADWLSGSGLAALFVYRGFAWSQELVARATDDELEQARIIYRAVVALYELELQPRLARLAVRSWVRARVELEGSQMFAPDGLRHNIASCLILALGVVRVLRLLPAVDVDSAVRRLAHLAAPCPSWPRTVAGLTPAQPAAERAA
jgi:hypothetical protein